MMKLQALREAVCRVNRELFASGLARFTFGNASGADREAGVAIIKPSGMAYDDMGPGGMVAVSLASGKRVAKADRRIAFALAQPARPASRSRDSSISVRVGPYGNPAGVSPMAHRESGP